MVATENPLVNCESVYLVLSHGERRLQTAVKYTDTLAGPTESDYQAEGSSGERHAHTFASRAAVVRVKTRIHRPDLQQLRVVRHSCASGRQRK